MTSSPQKIGFIGLGAMGRAMAANLLRDGAVQMLGTREEVFTALRKAAVMPAGAPTPLASVKARE